jgi:molybdopterin synthase catalytic subunit
MEVTVLLFASVAQKAGVRRVTVPLEAGDTVARVRDRVVDRFPQLASSLPTLLYALDEEYVRESEPVGAGATLALIPPVSGG